MLILDKVKCKKLQERLEEYSEYGTVLYYLYNENKILNIDLINMFFSLDDDKSSLSYMKVLKGLTSNDIEYAKNKYKDEYKEVLDFNTLNRLCLQKLISSLCNNNKIMNSKVYMNTYNYLLSH